MLLITRKSFIFLYCHHLRSCIRKFLHEYVSAYGLCSDGHSIPIEETDFFNQFNPVRGLYSFTFAYFILGGILFQRIDFFKEKIKSVYAVISYLISILFLTLYGLMISVSAQSVWDTVSSGFSTVFVLVASLCIYRLSLLCADSSESFVRKVIQKISQNSLGIYLFQSLLADVCYTYYLKCLCRKILRVISSSQFCCWLYAIC